MLHVRAIYAARPAVMSATVAMASRTGGTDFSCRRRPPPREVKVDDQLELLDVDAPAQHCNRQRYAGERVFVAAL